MTSTSENSLPKWEQAYNIQIDMNEKLTALLKLKENSDELSNRLIKDYPPTKYAADLNQEFLETYLNKYLDGTKNRKILLLGLNPGPNSSLHTGIAFVSPRHARIKLKLKSAVSEPVKLNLGNAESTTIVGNEEASPPDTNPKPNSSLKPGIELTDPEEICVSSRRLWKALAKHYSNIDAVFEDNFILNYCPFGFIKQGKNKTPWDLFDATTKPKLKEICDICDEGLVELIKLIEPKTIICIGRDVEFQVENLKTIKPVYMPHPSPIYIEKDDDWLNLEEVGKVLHDTYGKSNDLTTEMADMHFNK